MLKVFCLVDPDPNPEGPRTQLLGAATADDALAEVKRDYPAPKLGSAVFDPDGNVCWLYARYARETKPRWG